MYCFLFSRMDFLKTMFVSLFLQQPLSVTQNGWYIHDRATYKTFSLDKWSYYAPPHSTIVFNSPRNFQSRESVILTMLQNTNERIFNVEVLDHTTTLFREGKENIFAMSLPEDGGRWILTRTNKQNII